jgi:molybdenum cofactor cytidylyltransferase
MKKHSALYALLAAGFSRRFGSPKLLQHLPSGNTVIKTSISSLQASGCKFVVVIREDDNNLLEHIEAPNLEIIKVRKANQGLSSVIAECTSKLDSKQLECLGVCLADMPYMQPTTYQRLLEHASSETIVRPQYQGKMGHPVIFGRKFFPSLCSLSGDEGAKSVLKKHLDKLRVIDVNDPMILHDIDLPEDIIQA